MTDSLPSIRKELSAEEFEELREWIHKHSGIFLDAGGIDPLRISLVARATRLEISDHAEYFALLRQDEGEFKELMNLVTINETSFFRFSSQFDALRETVVPEILEEKSKMSRTFRAWSAGCSTGEEPYTIAMSLLDSQLASQGLTPEVLGTDVSTQALDRARAAVYRAKSLAGLPQHIAQRWFEPVSGGHRPVQAVRDVVDFSYHNLIKEPYPLALLGNWDVIFCRNVTIYFKFESTRRVVNNLFESLNPGGYLFIGHSETLTSISDRFEVVEIDGVFLYRKPRPRRYVTFDEVLASRQHAKKAPPSATAAAEKARAARRVPAAAVPPPPAEVPHGDEADAAPGSEIAAHVERAYQLLELGMPTQAREAADLALAADPESIDALIVRAYTHADDGDLDSAIQEARSVLAIDPLMPSAHYILGIIYLRQGLPDAAVQAFKHTIYSDRDFVLAHFSLANLYKSQARFDDACREFRNTLTALEHAPEGPWTAFLGGFRTDLLVQTCERSLIECRKGSSRT